MYKKFILLLFLLCTLTTNFVVAKDRDILGLTKIDPEKNAYVHNNYGILYLEQGQYYAAIEEFKIAICLNPTSQATAIYLNNLGETYLKLNKYYDAQLAFEKAIQMYPLNFKYYLNVVTSYQMRGILDSKLNYLLKHKSTPLDDITIGIIYVAKGQTDKGITILERFVMNEPKLYITDGVKYYLNGLIQARKQGLR